MAVKRLASTIVCDAGPNTIPGPVDLAGIQCAGAVTIAKGSDTILTFAAGTYKFDFRTAGPLIVTGACTLLLRTSRHD